MSESITSLTSSEQGPLGKRIELKGHQHSENSNNPLGSIGEVPISP